MKLNLTKRLLSLLLCLCLLLTLFAGLTIASAATGTLSRNTASRHITCTSLSSQAQAYYTAGTYDYATISAMHGVYSTDSWTVTQNNPVYTNLQRLMVDTHTNTSVVYSGTANGSLAYYWNYTDTVNSGSDYLLFYCDKLMSQVQNTEGHGRTGMEREHVWCKSKADYVEDSNSGGADLHHLRPSYGYINGIKSNRSFGNVPNGTDCTLDGVSIFRYASNSESGVMEVNDNIKGDVARILLYVYVRWGQPNLYTSYGSDISQKLKTAGVNTSGTINGSDDGTKIIDDLDTLLEWMEIDPVDTWEMQRNDQIENIQGNRNVFIDYPEFAWIMFGMADQMPTDMDTPSGYAKNGYTPPVNNWKITNASVSNQNYGSVTVTGDNTVSVTLQPDCYIANVTASSGTPVINGNVITVNNMTYDCTVTVILGKRYTVTLNNRGSITTQTCDVGDRITLPTGSGVSGFTFAGWVEQAIPGESATKPTILTGEYEPTATCTLYALYSRTSGGANGYTLSTEAPAAGETVILARLVDGTYYAMTASTTPGSSQITLTNGTVSDTSSILWDVVSGSNNTVRLKPSEATNYLHFNSGALKIANGTQNSDIIFTNAGNGTYTAKLNSDSNDRAIISKTVDNAETGFGCGAFENAIPLSIFKYSAGTTGYTTNPSNPSCTHTNTTVTGAVSATCTVPGYTGDTVCLSCGTTVSTGSVIPAKGHTSVSVAAVAATCETPGRNAGTKCSVCQTVLTGLTEIPAKGHNYIATTTKAATCTEDGVKTYTCSRSGCGSSYTEPINRLGHNYTDTVTTAATCGKDGVMTHTCSRCKDSYTTDIPATGNHSYNNGVTTTAATCTAPGVKTFTCTVCGDFYTQPINALGHNYEGKVTTAATCGKNGVMTYTCSRCPDSYTDVIPATGNHNYSSSYVSKSATCTQDGERTYTCSVCWGTKTEKIAALGHTYSNSVTTPATCTTDGIRTYTCTRCYKDSYTEVIPMTGHNLGKATNNYNKTYHTYYCQNSGCSYSENENHIFTESASGSRKTYTCTLCGYSYSSYLSTYTVTYIDPLKTSSVNVTEGSSTTPPATASAIDGYSFAGWSFDELSDEDTSATLQTASFKPTANVTLYAVYSRTEDVSGECTYTIVTNKNQLVSGKNVIITAKDYDFAMGDVLNNYYRDQVAVTKDVDEIIAGSDVYPFTLGSLSGGQWSLFDVRNNKYLTAYVSGSYYDLGTEDTLSDNGKFTFAISSNGTAGISTNSGSCNLVYLTGTYNDFGCKGSSSDGYACSLYIETPATYYTTNPHIPQTYVVSYSALGRISTTDSCTEGKSVTLPGCEEAAEGYTFVGWSEEQIDPEDTEATVLEVGTTYQPKNSITLYAVYSRTIQEGEDTPEQFVLSSTPPAVGDRIVIGYKYNDQWYILKNNGTSGAACTGTTTVSKDSVISVADAEGFELTVGEDVANNITYFYLTNGTTTAPYLHINASDIKFATKYASNSNGLFVAENAGNGQFTLKAYYNNKYLYFNGTKFVGNASSTPLSFFKYVGGTTETVYYTTNPTGEPECTHESTTLTGYLAATCTADGYTGDYVCDNCSETVTPGEVIPMLGHDTVTDAAVAPTCTATGLTEGHHCTRCDGDTLAQVVIPKLGHDRVTDAAVAATCTENGLTAGYHCSRCDEDTLAQFVIPKLGHDRVTDAAVAATCTESGLTAGEHCTRCDYAVAQEVIPATGHHYDANGVCSDCDDKLINITSAYLRLDEDIDVIYTAKVPEGATASMTFTMNGASVTVSDDGSHSFIFEGVTPQCMGDNISATLTVVVNNVTYTCTKDEYSVRTYCVNKLADETVTGAARKLISDTLAYGAAAQTYVNYKTNALVNDGDDIENPTYSAFTSLSGLCASFEGTAEENLCWVGAGLTLTDNVAMNFRFYAESVSGLSITVAINGRTQTFTEFTNVGENLYEITFYGIKANEFADTVSASFSTGGNTVNYSVNTYVCAKQADGNAALANLVKALYNYGASAAAYTK